MHILSNDLPRFLQERRLDNFRVADDPEVAHQRSSAESEHARATGLPSSSSHVALKRRLLGPRALAWGQ